MDDDKCNVIVISSGGIRGCGFLGILHSLIIKHNFDIDNIKYYGGSSIGALICTLLCFNYTPFEIYLLIIQLLPLSYNNDKNILLEKLKSIIKDTTFLDLYNNTQKVLIITSYDMKNKLPLYYTKDTFPNKSVFQAISETINVPFFMSNDDTNLDGCLCSPFPIKYCKELVTDEKAKCLGLYSFINCKNFLPIKNLYDDYKTIVNQLLNNLISYELFFTDEKDYIIKFESNEPFEMINIDNEISQELFLKGFNFQ